MAKYIAADITDGIKATKQDIANGVEDKYPDSAAVSQYYQEIPTGKVERIGDIYDGRLDDQAAGCLVCDGSLIQDSLYPELAAMLKGNVSRIISQDFTTTQAGVPSIPAAAHGVRFTLDNEYLVVLHETSPYLKVIRTSDWTTVSGTPTLPGAPTGSGRADIAMSPDGQYVAVSHLSAQTLSILNTSDWSFVSGAPVISTSVLGIAFSPNGKQMALSISSSPYLKVYNVSDWSEVSGTPVPAAQPAGGLTYSPDGNFIVVGNLNDTTNIQIYRTSDWSEVTRIPEFGGRPTCLRFSPDGRYMVATHYTFSGEYVRVVDWTDMSVRTLTLDDPSTVSWEADFSPDGKYLVVCHNRTLTASPKHKVFRTSDWTAVSGSPNLSTNSVYGMDYSPDGSKIAFAHNGSPYLTVVNAADVVADGFTPLPNLPSVQHGNIKIKPLIRAEIA